MRASNASSDLGAMTGPQRVVRRYAILLSALALASAAPAAWAQNAPAGDWQGELENTGLTVVLHIHQNGPSRLDSPVQGAYGLKTDLISKDSTVDFSVPSIGASFHGVLRGTTITGTYSQHGNDVPLVFSSIKAGSAKPAAPAPNPGPPLPRSLAGIWRGILEGPGLPLVLHIDTAGVSTIDSPRQKAFGMRANVIVIGDSLRFTIPAVRASFHGTFSGSTIGGEFSQNGGTIPLTLKRTGG
jgi:hypothetical protein